VNGDCAQWYLGKRILLQLSNRCEILVWRSLARKTFLLSGTQGNASNKRAPTLDLQDMLVLATFLERRALEPDNPATRTPHTNSIFMSPIPITQSEQQGYVDPDLTDAVEPGGPDLPSIARVESIVASLVEQDLLHGFISHKSLRFAITGSKIAGALSAGFPRVWDVIKSKVDDEVPGWVRETKSNGLGAPQGLRAGPGMVVNLSNARPVGAAPA